MPGSATAAPERPSPVWICVAAWAIPGAGHVLLGQLRRGAVFFVVLVAMFVIGLASSGRLFPFQAGDPLMLLAAAAQWALGLPRIAAALGGWGAGIVTAPAYEYGNTFFITAGLLNILIVLDAWDRATGRKPIA